MLCITVAKEMGSKDVDSFLTVHDVHLEPRGGGALLKWVGLGSYLLTVAKTIRNGE